MNDTSEIDAILRAGLDCTLSQTDLSGLGRLERGKVRDCYITDDGRRFIVVTDRISAFDVVLGTIPFKGQVLNQIAQYWFEESAHVAANHLIAVRDPNVMEVRECTPLSAEFVMRGYLTGTTDTSIWRAYERGDREFCGHRLPDGMVRHQRLAKPLLTPSTKAEKGGHDVSVSRAQLIEGGHVSESDFERAQEIVTALFELGQARARERGLILVDTKYELGRTNDGEIIVIDEIHTPDSSRYWYAEDYDARMAEGADPRSLDKEFVRRWLAEECGYRGDGPAPELTPEIRIEAAKRYMEIFALVTGRPFVPDSTDPHQRISLTLGLHED